MIAIPWKAFPVRQMQLFTSAELAVMRDRNASRNILLTVPPVSLGGRVCADPPVSREDQLRPAPPVSLGGPLPTKPSVSRGDHASPAVSPGGRVSAERPASRSDHLLAALPVPPGDCVSVRPPASWDDHVSATPSESRDDHPPAASPVFFSDGRVAAASPVSSCGRAFVAGDHMPSGRRKAPVSSPSPRQILIGGASAEFLLPGPARRPPPLPKVIPARGPPSLPEVIPNEGIPRIGHSQPRRDRQLAERHDLPPENIGSDEVLP